MAAQAKDTTVTSAQSEPVGSCDVSLYETYLAELRRREDETDAARRKLQTRSDLSRKIQHYTREQLPVQCDRQIVADTKFKYYLKLFGYKLSKFTAWSIIIGLSLLQSIAIMHWIAPTSEFKLDHDNWHSWTPDDVKAAGW